MCSMARQAQLETPTARIAVVGSINMDLLVRSDRLPRPGETVLADDVRESPGGKGANQAVAAARLGAAVAMIGRVGSDAFADRLLGNLGAEGVNTRWVQRTAECASGLAIVAVDRTGENSITVVPGANRQVSPEDILAAADVIREADVALMQLEIPIDTVLAAIQVARDAGTQVILDPAPAPSTLHGGLLDVDVICPNASEAAALLGRDIASVDDAMDASLSLTKLGVAQAIVTLGRDGAVVCDTEGRREHIVSPRVDAVDTTAAGDAFAAALGVRLAERTPLAEAVRFACRAGALAASRPGAQPAMPTREEVTELQ